MSNYRFKLEPYKGVRSRHRCPACERPRCFARYIDTEGKVEFPDHVGRCDHEQGCAITSRPETTSLRAQKLRQGYAQVI